MYNILMKIHCLSDLHGKYAGLPQIDCELLLISGDILSTFFGRKRRDVEARVQADEFNNLFSPWLGNQKFEKCVFIWGNHDFIGEKFDISNLNIPNNVIHLQDSHVDIEINNKNVKIFGTPWTPWFYDWAFNAPLEEVGNKDEPFLNKKFSNCPDNVDIILSHGPPQGILDRTIDDLSVGSKALLSLVNRVKPKLFVCGHIHEATGVFDLENTRIINASVVDLKHRIQHEGFKVEL